MMTISRYGVPYPMEGEVSKIARIGKSLGNFARFGSLYAKGVKVIC